MGPLLDFSRSNSWKKTLHRVAYTFRVLKVGKGTKLDLPRSAVQKIISSKPISCQEIQNAERFLIREAQIMHPPNDRHEKVAKTGVRETEMMVRQR